MNMNMNMEMKMNKLLVPAAAVLAILLDVGCGGTIDLTILKQTDGAGASSPMPSAGYPNVVGGGAGSPNVVGGGAGGEGGQVSGTSGSGGQPAATCTVDDDCVECYWQTDANVSGCFIPCCETTAMNATTCEQHLQSFRDLCPQVACTAMCVAPPKPMCMNGQCVHGQ